MPLQIMVSLSVANFTIPVNWEHSGGLQKNEFENKNKMDDLHVSFIEKNWHLKKKHMPRHPLPTPLRIAPTNCHRQLPAAAVPPLLHFASFLPLPSLPSLPFPTFSSHLDSEPNKNYSTQKSTAAAVKNLAFEPIKVKTSLQRPSSGLCTLNHVFKFLASRTWIPRRKNIWFSQHWTVGVWNKVSWRFSAWIFGRIFR